MISTCTYNSRSVSVQSVLCAVDVCVARMGHDTYFVQAILVADFIKLGEHGVQEGHKLRRCDLSDWVDVSATRKYKQPQQPCDTHLAGKVGKALHVSEQDGGVLKVASNR